MELLFRRSGEMRSQHELEREIKENQRAQKDLCVAHQQLEARVRKSDADLALANEQMRQLAAIVESSEDAIVGCTLGGFITIWNQGAERLFGYPAEEIIGQSTSTNARLDCPEELKALKRVRAGEHIPPFETVRRRKDGKQIHVSVSISPIRDDDGRIVGASAISRDISERKRLEEQVRQAQKMEAIGRLAGGVAHDFNNLLTIISGYTDMVLTTLGPDSPMSGSLTEVQRAGERAASLTRQLLAFSRQQVLEPRVLDLNAIVTDTEKMLRRLIGEDVSLTTVLAPALGRIKADRGQLEQVIVNLVVNARDAMPNGGKVTIETANVDLDQACFRTRPEVQPGSYIVMAVSDTGHGMDEATKARIFEPFFTTKGLGKGTGLGLATVYGIVKQSGGCIYVYSEPGLGSTFKVYLPSVEDKISSGKSSQGSKVPLLGKETILLVEDEAAVRAVTRHALQSFGYTVLEARDGPEAIRICQEYKPIIHLLVSDVVMPEMGGRHLAERLATMIPRLKVLYLSGYTDDAIVRHGTLQEGTAFLQKPFTPKALANKVREVLDATDA
jgi:two-component system cell cycle sensor histidine kinase/response regulator CckA